MTQECLNVEYKLISDLIEYVNFCLENEVNENIADYAVHKELEIKNNFLCSLCKLLTDKQLEKFMYCNNSSMAGQLNSWWEGNKRR